MLAFKEDPVQCKVCHIFYILFGKEKCKFSELQQYLDQGFQQITQQR